MTTPAAPAKPAAPTPAVPVDKAPTPQVKGTENPLPFAGDHDRVQMLSLHADGSAAQHNPELIGDKDVALAQTREQFRQQAVSALDTIKRPELFGDGEGLAGSGEPSGAAKELRKLQDEVSAAATARADEVVNKLHQG
jgi:hypothetical protein